MAIGDDAFRVFISHKQEDHALAVEVKRAMEDLAPELIDCFVSGVDIAAGSDWRREIRSVLAESHLLVLLFTAPTKNWDWCLYETGLYTRFDLADPRSVVCLSAAGQASPSPLADLQGVPVDVDRLATSWIRCAAGHGRSPTTGAAARWRPRSQPDRVEAAARPSSRASAGRGRSRPTTRAIALSCRFPSPTTWRVGFPRARGSSWGQTTPTAYTLSLFDLAGGDGTRSWGDLLAAVDGSEADWRRELDSHFLHAVDEHLFAPVEGRMRCAGAEPGSRDGSTVRSSTASCAGRRSGTLPGSPGPTSDHAP